MSRRNVVGDDQKSNFVFISRLNNRRSAARSAERRHEGINDRDTFLRKFGRTYERIHVRNEVWNIDNTVLSTK